MGEHLCYFRSALYFKGVNCPRLTIADIVHLTHLLFAIDWTCLFHHIFFHFFWKSYNFFALIRADLGVRRAEGASRLSYAVG